MGRGGSRGLVGRPRANLKSSGWTSRARKIEPERLGLGGDVVALQEDETPANGVGGGTAREPDGRRGACGVVFRIHVCEESRPASELKVEGGMRPT